MTPANNDVFSRSEDRWGSRTYHLNAEGVDLRSVTTWLSKGMPKPALYNWFKTITAEAAVDDLDIVAAMVAKGPEGRKAAIDHLVGASYRKSDKAKDVGSEVHEIAEAMANGWPIPEVEHAEDVAPFVKGLELFFAEWRPEFIATEVTVFNVAQGYAGSFDGIMRAAGSTWLIDWKTTKPGKEGHGIYPEYGLQLAAYRYAEFMVTRDGTRQPMPPVDGCLGINIRPGQYAVIPVRADERVFAAFTYVQQVAAFVEQGKAIIGEAMAPPIGASV